MLGIGLALLRDMLDNTVKDREPLEKITGSGVVGDIPFDKSRTPKSGHLLRDDNSPTAEAFRKLRTNLQFLSVDNPPRLIVVTSSSPNEGKSTTCDQHRSCPGRGRPQRIAGRRRHAATTLARYLDMVGSVGFSTVLSGAASLDDVLQESKFPRLTVLTAGATPPNPSELLGSMAAKKMLSDIARPVRLRDHRLVSAARCHRRRDPGGGVGRRHRVGAGWTDQTGPSHACDPYAR